MLARIPELRDLPSMVKSGFQTFAIQRLLSLPPSVLRLMSGGAGVHTGGRTLDPRFQFLGYQARRNTPPEPLPPEEARPAVRAMMAAMNGKAEPGVSWEAFNVETVSGLVPCRLYRPADQDGSAPVLVYAHGGGGVIGDLETCHALCTILAKTLRAAVLSVHYRLAPEHRYPAGVDDVLAVYRFARDHARTFGAPTGHAAIGGDSIGGNFAAVVCQDLKAAGEPQPVFQLLIYPCVDVASETASMTTYGQAWPLGGGLMDWFLLHYMGPEADPSDVRLSPVKAADLSGLAPAIIAAAGYDMLLDQGRDYAVALKAAGVEVTYRCFDSLVHGFVEFTGAVPAADAACREIAGLARDMVEGGVA